jgi:integrase
VAGEYERTELLSKLSVRGQVRLDVGMLSKGLSAKTVRNVLTYVYSVFEYAVERGLVSANPVRHVTRPGRRRQGDVSPDLRFLTVEELEAVIRAIPDEVVIREPAPTRKGRPGPAPPLPPDVLGPVLRVLVLTAAMTGLRQSELVPKIVESDWGHSGSPTCCLESLRHLRAVERVAGLRMGEHEVLVRRVAAAT